MSNRTTFACTVLKALDDKGNRITYQAGDVVRRDSDRPEAWTDCIILGFSRPDEYDTVYVKLARPYAYANCIGTTSPSILTGVEKFTVPASKLRYEKVVSHRPMVSGSELPVDRGYDSEIIDLVSN